MSKLLMTPRFIWAALLVSQAIYVAMVFVPGLLEPSKEPIDPTLLVALVAWGVGAALGSFFFPPLILRPALERARFELVERADPHASALFRDASPKIRAYAQPEEAQRAALQVGFPAFIVTLALCEAASVDGVLIRVMGGPPAYSAVCFAVGITMTALRFPTERTFLAPVEKKTGVRFG